MKIFAGGILETIIGRFFGRITRKMFERNPEGFSKEKYSRIYDRVYRRFIKESSKIRLDMSQKYVLKESLEEFQME